MIPECVCGLGDPQNTLASTGVPQVCLVTGSLTQGLESVLRMQEHREGAGMSRSLCWSLGPSLGWVFSLVVWPNACGGLIGLHVEPVTQWHPLCHPQGNGRGKQAFAILPRQRVRAAQVSKSHFSDVGLSISTPF